MRGPCWRNAFVKPFSEYDDFLVIRKHGSVRLGDLAEATSPLWERLQARQLNKPVFNVPPREQARWSLERSAAAAWEECDLPLRVSRHY